MNEIYQQLLKHWTTLAPDECLTTKCDYRFKVRILSAVEKCDSLDAWRLITTENFAMHLANKQSIILLHLNFILLTVIHHCAARQSSISFTFTELGTIATICNGLKSQPHPHPAIAALDAYIQLLEF